MASSGQFPKVSGDIIYAGDVTGRSTGDLIRYQDFALGSSRLNTLIQSADAFGRIYLTLTGTVTNFDLYTYATSQGWNSNYQLILTIATSTVVSSTLTSVPGMTINNSYPKGLNIINNGKIFGQGGAGGNTISVGLSAGPAISVSSSTVATITNNGIIAGGGGGGGAGVFWSWNGLNRSTPGSGGASGTQLASGGGGGPNTQGAASIDSNADGIYETPGPSQNWGWGGRASSPGGKGGDWGAAGDAGGTVDGVYNYTGYAGGLGGKAISLNGSSVNLTNNGSIYGAIS